MANKKNIIKVLECGEGYVITEDGKRWEFDCDVVKHPTVDSVCITEDGRIFVAHTYGLKERKIKSVNDAGYPIMSLRDTKGNITEATIHRIVWTAFVGEEPPYAVDGERIDIAHLDDDKWNASLDNLMLVTHKLNCQAIKDPHALDDIKKSRQMAKDMNLTGLEAFNVANEFYRDLFGGKLYY